MHATTLFFSLLVAAASVVALPTLAERQISGSISVNFYPTSDPGCNKNDALIEDFTLFTPSSCTLIDIEGQAIGGTLLNENDLNSGCSRTFLCSPLLCRSTEHMSKIWDAFICWHDLFLFDSYLLQYPELRWWKPFHDHVLNSAFLLCPVCGVLYCPLLVHGHRSFKTAPSY